MWNEFRYCIAFGTVFVGSDQVYELSVAFAVWRLLNSGMFRFMMRESISLPRNAPILSPTSNTQSTARPNSPAPYHVP